MLNAIESFVGWITDRRLIMLMEKYHAQEEEKKKVKGLDLHDNAGRPRCVYIQSELAEIINYLFWDELTYVRCSLCYCRNYCGYSEPTLFICDKCCERMIINDESIEKRVSRINFLFKDLIKSIKDNQEFNTMWDLMPQLLENERRQWDKQMEYLQWCFEKDKLHKDPLKTIEQRKENMLKLLEKMPEKHESHRNDKIKWPFGQTIKKIYD